MKKYILAVMFIGFPMFGFAQENYGVAGFLSTLAFFILGPIVLIAVMITLRFLKRYLKTKQLLYLFLTILSIAGMFLLKLIPDNEYDPDMVFINYALIAYFLILGISGLWMAWKYLKKNS